MRMVWYADLSADLGLALSGIALLPEILRGQGMTRGQAGVAQLCG